MNKDERIKELEKIAMQLFDMIHESEHILNKIKANELYDIIVKKLPIQRVIDCPLCGGEMAFVHTENCMTEGCPNCVF